MRTSFFRVHPANPPFRQRATCLLPSNKYPRAPSCFNNVLHTFLRKISCALRTHFTHAAAERYADAASRRRDSLTRETQCTKLSLPATADSSSPSAALPSHSVRVRSVLSCPVLLTSVWVTRIRATYLVYLLPRNRDLTTFTFVRRLHGARMHIDAP